jgi:hypothetical protein
MCHPKRGDFLMSDDEPKTQLESSKGGSGGFPPTRIGGGHGRRIPSSDSVVCCACKQLVDCYLPVLPFMAAYVCTKCITDRKQQSVSESKITNKVISPWTESETAAINEYQHSDNFLPFVCPLGHVLIARSQGFYCEECPEFSLNWTCPWVLNSFWKQL